VIPEAERSDLQLVIETVLDDFFYEHPSANLRIPTEDIHILKQHLTEQMARFKELEMPTLLPPDKNHLKNLDGVPSWERKKL
jgi:hypothetical protein